MKKLLFALPFVLVVIAAALRSPTPLIT